MRLSPIMLAISVAGFSSGALATSVQEQLNNQNKEIELLKQQLAQLSSQNKSVISTEMSPNLSTSKDFEFSSYGTINYRSEEIFSNVQDTDPERRSKVDIERLVAEFKYNFDPKWSVEFEVEFEHGGTGSTMEYDGFEEFGEFETELEAGGEVIVEKLELEYKHSKAFGAKFGHIYVPVGLGASHHKPHQYFTVRRHRSVESMIPGLWHETGVGVFGEINNFHYQAQVVTGLNSEFFRSYNWASGGSQTRFEEVNADSLATVVRLDYGNIKQGSAIGFSYYQGKTSDNRHKTNKMTNDGQVSIFDLHGVYQNGPITLRAQYLFGELENSSEITLANKTTPGLRPGNFSLVGSEAEAYFVSAGYDIAPMLGHDKSLQVFASYDHSNPLKKVEDTTATTRFDISEMAIGINYFPIKQLVLKAQFANQEVATSTIDDTTSFELGIGYYFSI